MLDSSKSFRSLRNKYFAFIPYYAYLTRNEFEQISSILSNSDLKIKTLFVLLNQMHSLDEYQARSSLFFDTIEEYRLANSRSGFTRIYRIIYALFHVSSLAFRKDISVYFINSHLGGVYIRSLILLCILLNKPICAVWAADFEIKPKVSFLTYILCFPLLWPLLIAYWPDYNPFLFSRISFIVTSLSQRDTLLQMGADPKKICIIEPFRMSSCLLTSDNKQSITLCLENLYEVYHPDLCLRYYLEVITVIKECLPDLPLYVRPHPREDSQFLSDLISSLKHNLNLSPVIWNSESFNLSSIHVFCQSSLFLKLPPNNIPTLRLAHSDLRIIPKFYDLSFLQSQSGHSYTLNGAFDMSNSEHLARLKSWLTTQLETMSTNHKETNIQSPRSESTSRLLDFIRTIASK